MSRGKQKRRPPSEPTPRLEAVPAKRLERCQTRRAEMMTEERHLDAVERGAVEQLRADGASWSAIGRLTGLSKAGAHKKWSRPDHPPKTH